MNNHCLEHLKRLAPETQLLKPMLAAFTQAKEPTADNFREGVRRFIDLANMLPDERTQVYGSRFAGVYIHNDLAHLWNEQCLPHQRVTAHSLDALKPAEWRIINKDDCIALEYSGLTPAEALNSLLRGPTVIDCGMFCQLGMWFGIRFILGDDAFNAHFGNQSFLITRFIYQRSVEGKEHVGNPLFDFFSAEKLVDSVAIEHVFNVQKYSLKHPGGTSGGQNCLVMGDTYFIFNPLSSQKQFTHSEIVTQLLQAYNAPQDTDDRDTLTTFETNASFFQSEHGSIYSFPDCTFFWANLLHKNPGFRESYTNAMLAIPECREQMNHIFGDKVRDPKTCFLTSFATAQANRDKYEAFYALGCVKKVFQEQLESQPQLFNQYYWGVLEIFAEYHQAVADEILCLQDYDANRQSRMSTIPSYLYFDLNAFLSSLRKDKRPIQPDAAIPKSQKRSASILPQASQAQATFFAVSSNDQTLNLVTEPPAVGL